MKTTAGIAFTPISGLFLGSDLLRASAFTGEGSEAKRIGEVGNVILSVDRTVEAVVVDVGGFLNIGEKPVALDFEPAKWTEDEDGNRHLTIAAHKEMHDALQAFDNDSLKAERHGSLKMDEQTAANDSLNTVDEARSGNTTPLEKRVDEEPVRKPPITASRPRTRPARVLPRLIRTGWSKTSSPECATV